ncbi:MAG: hypothetical protein MZU97_23125 [Bacillus subtilis]|nr:hypothetical protein [Bacillus subtilis]
MYQSSGSTLIAGHTYEIEVRMRSTTTASFALGLKMSIAAMRESLPMAVPNFHWLRTNGILSPTR